MVNYESKTKNMLSREIENLYNEANSNGSNYSGFMRVYSHYNLGLINNGLSK